jgi:hypothetical protein
VADPTPPPTPRPIPGGGINVRRRMVMYLALGTLVLSLVFALVLGAFAYFMVKSGRARYSDQVPSDFPSDVYLCNPFFVNHSIVFDSPDNGTHYELEGDCQVSQAVLSPTYVSELEYRGWTVHDDGQGDLTAYSYETHREVSVVLNDSGAGANATTVRIVVLSRVLPVPDDFALPTPSPR